MKQLLSGILILVCTQFLTSCSWRLPFINYDRGSGTVEAGGPKRLTDKNVNQIEPAVKAGETNYIADKRIITDSMKDFQFKSPNTATNEEGFLIVQVEVQNRRSKDTSFEYRFQWTDENGMLFETPASHWTEKFIKAGEWEFIKGVAPSPKVKDFRLKIKRKK